MNAQLQRRPEVERAASEKARFRRLRRVEPIQRAVVAPSGVLRRIWTQPRVAEFFPVQRPVNEESQGGPLGPLPAYEFGSQVSCKPASRASIAAFNATA